MFLAGEKFYDSTWFHRIVPGGAAGIAVIQGGDPEGSGRGGPGYAIKDELPSSPEAYKKYSVAMANSGPDSGGSQFFVNFEDNSKGLQPNYSVFGEVVDGRDVVDKIAQVQVGGQSGDTPPSRSGSRSSPSRSPRPPGGERSMTRPAAGLPGGLAVVICVPGPDTALTVRNALAGGRRCGVATAAGVATGQAVWTVATSVGIAELIQASEPAFLVLKPAGAAYLVALGIQSLWTAVGIRFPGRLRSPTGGPGPGPGGSRVAPGGGPGGCGPGGRCGRGWSATWPTRRWRRSS